MAILTRPRPFPACQLLWRVAAHPDRRAAGRLCRGGRSSIADTLSRLVEPQTRNDPQRHRRPSAQGKIELAEALKLATDPAEDGTMSLLLRNFVADPGSSGGRNQCVRGLPSHHGSDLRANTRSRNSARGSGSITPGLMPVFTTGYHASSGTRSRVSSATTRPGRVATPMPSTRFSPRCLRSLLSNWSWPCLDLAGLRLRLTEPERAVQLLARAIDTLSPQETRYPGTQLGLLTRSSPPG